jgi:hypothetical protein
MQHCGDAQFNMASLRDPQGKPHVTADLNFDYKAIRQLKGKQNAVIDEKYWDACGQLFKHLGEQSKRMWQFDDNLYLRSQKGIDFLEFLNEFKYAFTGWDKQLMNPGNVQVPDDDQAWDHFDNGN